MNHIPLITWDSDPLTEQEVTIVESAIGKLSTDYRQFLLSRNGGRTLDDEVRFPDPNDYFIVTEFAVIDPKFPPKVLTATLRRAVCQLIKIAEGYDKPFLMQLNGRNAGTVYYWYWTLENYWDSQEAGDQYLPEAGSICKLASSFTDFVNRLVRVNSVQKPKLKEMVRSVENFAKYGDQYFDHAKAFFDELTIDELNQRSPKGSDDPFPALLYAARWTQIRICKYLIDRGVDIHADPRITQCASNYEITKLMIQAGATDQELRQLLFAAALGITSTRVPEEHHKIVMHLVERGVQPDFADPDVLEEWTQGINGIVTKKMLSFLASEIAFPSSILDLIRDKLSKRVYDNVNQD